jgi:branched-chain amino acid transport system ATP-binding protein
MPDGAALQVEELAASYGPVRAVDGVSLSVASGGVTAVLGANGAGKTSLLRAISGLLRPRAGRVLLHGRDVVGVPVEEIVRRGMSHIPEGRGVIGELTVEENLRLGALWRGDRDQAASTLAETYERFSALRERRTMPAATLSGGERQMLSIARALMSRPSVLLLDEPSLGLAPRIAGAVMRLVHDLAGSTGLAVLLVEQNARSALSIADDAVVLSLGRTVASGAAERLAGDDRLRHAYLGF